METLTKPAKAGNAVPPAILDLILERLPLRPFCAIDYRSTSADLGLKIRSQEVALSMPTIQLNRPGQKAWLVFDCDHNDIFAYENAELPPPTWIAVNRDHKQHSHVAYALATPVCTTPNGHEKPIKYVAAIEALMTKALGADRGYAGFVTKNPLHPRYHLLWGSAHAYDLGELAEYLSLENYKPPRSLEIDSTGLGRNSTLFLELRTWAYVAIREYREMRSATANVAWLAEVTGQAAEINSRFAVPLPESEVRHAAKQVAKFCWKNDLQCAVEFSERQAVRGAKGGLAKGAANEDKRASATLMRASGQTQLAISQALGVSERTIRTWLKKTGN